MRPFVWRDRYWMIAVGGGLLIVLLWIGATAEIVRSRGVILEYTNRQLSSLASALAEQTARALQGSEFILRRMSVWALDPNNAHVSAARAQTFLRAEMDGVPQIRRLEIIDASGNRTAMTLPDPMGTNIASRAYFEQLKNASGTALVISEPLVSLVDERPTFAIARRLQDASGHFKGVVLAMIDEDYFRDFYRRIDLGRGTSIRLSREDGTPVVTFEDPEAHDKPIKNELSATRLVSGFPMTITVTRDEALALEAWRTSTIYELVGAAALSLFVVVLGMALVRQLRRLGHVNRRLESSQQSWRAVFDNAPSGIALYREHGCYLAANPAFQRMVGYSMKELAQLTASDITHPEDVETTRRNTELLLSNGEESLSFEKRYVHRDGRTVWADSRIARVTVSTDGEGNAPPRHEVVIVATVEDVTQRREDEQARRQLESQLRQSQKLEALGTFAGGIAHDFNNILGAIIGYGELAVQSLAQDAPQRRYVDQVLKAGDRARSLVERILTFSRSAMTVREPVRVQETVSGSIELFKVRLPESIRLEVALDAAGAYIAGDPAHLDQVVINLCGNALHAMTEGGTLRIELITVHLDAPRSLSHGAIGAGEFARLAVIDTGIGMPAELLERIFNPFFTTRKAGEGTGLGLSLVDGIVREYGGGVDVHSVVGAGTRFEVFLPLIEAAPTAETGEHSTWRHGEGQTILLVDDEEALVTLGEETLAEFGYEPVGFTSSTAAWKAFEANPQRFDAVLTDQTMPEMTGIELAKAIKRCRSDIPIILASGYGNPALERDAQAAGVQVVLHKPLRKAEIAHALSQALFG